MGPVFQTGEVAPQTRPPGNRESRDDIGYDPPDMKQHTGDEIRTIMEEMPAELLAALQDILTLRAPGRRFSRSAWGIRPAPLLTPICAARRGLAPLRSEG
jgi:hypothetical protein